MSPHSKRELVQRLQPRCLQADRQEKQGFWMSFRRNRDAPQSNHSLPMLTKPTQQGASWATENIYWQRSECRVQNRAHGSALLNTSLWRNLRQAAPSHSGQHGCLIREASGTQASEPRACYCR